MNVELLQKVKAHVLEEPRRVFMGAWCLQDVHIRLNGLQVPDCNTIACISGWSAQLYNQDRRLSIGMPGYVRDREGEIALDITLEQAGRLFYLVEWPDDLYFKIKDTILQSTEYAQVVAERIDRFIATEGRE
jgi:hypothetical protein